MRYSDYIKIKKYWDENAKSILLRCAKEVGAYEEIIMLLSKQQFNSKLIHYKPIHNAYKRERIFFDICNRVDYVLNLDFGQKVRFTDENGEKLIKRTYPAFLALNNNRYFSHMIAAAIIPKCDIKEKIQDKLLKMFDKQLFEKHKLNAFLAEKFSSFIIFLFN